MIYAVLAIVALVWLIIGLVVGFLVGARSVWETPPQNEALARALAATTVELQTHKRISRAAQRLVDALSEFPNVPEEWRYEIGTLEEALGEVVEAQRAIDRPSLADA